MENEKRPGLFGRLRDALLNRATAEPKYPQQNRIAWTPRTTAGVHVNEDNALQVSAVFACMRYICQTVGMLPWHVIKDGPNGAEIQRNNHIDKLLYLRPSPEYSSQSWREVMTFWALRYGNSVAEIEPDQVGRPVAIHPIHPDRVAFLRSDNEVIDGYGDAIPAGQLYYEIDGKTVLSAKRVVHIRGFGEGPLGINVITYAAQTIGWAKAVQLFGAAFFGNGANLAGIVRNKVPMSVEGLEAQKASFKEWFSGPRNAHKTAFLDQDAEYEEIGTTPEDSQFVATNKYLVEEIARFFGVPLHKIGSLEHATFTNIEHQSIEAVVDCISPWVQRFESEIDYKLFRWSPTGLYSKMSMRALLRGDTKARGEYYKMMREVGAYSVNRILELEDENTIGPIGDMHTMNSAYAPLDRIADGTAAGAAPTPANDNGAVRRAA